MKIYMDQLKTRIARQQILRKKSPIKNIYCLIDFDIRTGKYSIVKTFYKHVDILPTDSANIISIFARINIPLHYDKIYNLYLYEIPAARSFTSEIQIFSKSQHIIKISPGNGCIPLGQIRTPLQL